MAGRRVKTTVQPQHDHDWQLIIEHHPGVYYLGGGPPGYGWTNSSWIAKKFQCMQDVREEIKKWNPRDVQGELTIRRVWSCVGEVRGKTRVGEDVTFPKKRPTPKRNGKDSTQKHEIMSTI